MGRKFDVFVCVGEHGRYMINKRGFTIVELLIVIVVIGIIAAIVVIAFNGVQSKARDSQRKSDVAAISKALGLYRADNGPMYTGSGCGANGNGSGYFNYPYTAPGSDMNECLKTSGHLKSDIRDPQNVSSCSVGNLSCRKYMKYTCVQSSLVVTYVYANLETIGHTTTDTDGTCSGNVDTDYGMNYYVRVTS
jgi:prepilin-type N-terminal cleavage/methylation domain-containing protein